MSSSGAASDPRSRRRDSARSSSSAALGAALPVHLTSMYARPRLVAGMSKFRRRARVGMKRDAVRLAGAVAAPGAAAQQQARVRVAGDRVWLARAGDDERGLHGVEAGGRLVQRHVAAQRDVDVRRDADAERRLVAAGGVAGEAADAGADAQLTRDRMAGLVADGKPELAVQAVIGTRQLQLQAPHEDVAAVVRDDAAVGPLGGRVARVRERRARSRSTGRRRPSGRSPRGVCSWRSCPGNEARAQEVALRARARR